MDMTLDIKHAFVSTKADGGDDTLVKPSDWNASHSIVSTGSTGMVLGRDNTGPGSLQELPINDICRHWCVQAERRYDGATTGGSNAGDDALQHYSLDP
jgi:hypothetical protein